MHARQAVAKRGKVRRNAEAVAAQARREAPKGEPAAKRVHPAQPTALRVAAQARREAPKGEPAAKRAHPAQPTALRVAAQARSEALHPTNAVGKGISALRTVPFARLAATT